MSQRNILFFFIVFLQITHQTFAQNSFYNKARIGLIDENTALFQSKYNSNTEIVKALSQKLKIDIRRSLGNERFMELKGVNEIGEPIFTISESNLQAGQTTHTNSIYKGGSLGIDFIGKGLTTFGRLGVWDGGKVLATHVEFGGRVLNMDNTSSSSTHSTHVGGTMVAEGINAIAKGMAPGAQLKSWDYINDDTEMSNASKELLVSNHSYGQVVGWVYNDARQGNQKWEWYGNNQISTFEDYKFGFYDSQSQTWDRIAYNAPNYLIVKSAGNKRNENGPGRSATDTTKTSEKYFLGSSSDSSFVVRSPNTTFDNLPTYSVAKNILTVGAVSIIPNGADLASDIKISSFSSWGPTDDGRIKPDIVGAGVNLFSPSDLGDKAYTFLSGTSMSSPQVAGSVFLLQEIYASLNNNKLMRSSTLKGLALHSADDAGRPGPDYTFGWGLLNIEKASKILINKEKTNSLEELTLAENGVFTKKIIANGKGPVVATICWTDPEASPTTATSTNLNSRIPKLVNDLDIVISDGKTNFQAWVLDPNKPVNIATKGDNFRDNVEQVLIANPVPGKEYTIKITHKTLLTKGLQDYALIVSGVGGNIYCKPTIATQQESKFEKVAINNFIYNAANNCVSYTDKTDQIVEVSPGQKVDIEANIGNCVGQKTKTYGVFIDWNIDGDFDDIGEKLAESEPLSNINTFKNSINVPQDAIPGYNYLFRLITTETNEAKGCQTNSKGETIDFTLSIINPKVDIGITNLVFPDENICRNTSIDNVSIQLENKGTQQIVEGEINVKVFENEIEIATQKATLKAVIPGLTNSRITIPIILTFKANAKYKFEFLTKVGGDENQINDHYVIERSVNTDLLAQDSKVINCENSTLTTLYSANKGTAFWYDSETDGKLIAVGNNVSIKKTDTPVTLYATYNDISGQIGPKSKKEYSGGTYSGNFGPKPYISTKAPIILESARLYIGHSGKIIFTVERVSDLTPISSVTLDVTATRDSKLGNASNGQQLDDPNDPGAIYNLGLEIPEPGDYQISIEYEDEASIFRSNQGVSGFPFTLQNAVTISGSAFNGSKLTEAWYYFYNLKVRSLGCQSPKRVLADMSIGKGLVSTINASGSTTLCPSQTVTLATIDNKDLQYQWFKDSTLIADANKNIIEISKKGKYYLLISNNGICPTPSNSITVNTKSPAAPTITTTGNVLNSSPAENYQWLLSRNPITGANKQEFTAFETGSYSMKAVVEGCEVQSFEIYVVILADEVVNIGENLTLFPNPVIDKFSIKNIREKLVKYQILNALGQKITENEINNTYLEQPSISVNYLQPGQYYVRIEVDKKIYLKKFIKL